MRALVQGDLSTPEGKVGFAADLVALEAGFMFGAMLPVHPAIKLGVGAAAPSVIESASMKYLEPLIRADWTPGIEERMELLMSETPIEKSDLPIEISITPSPMIENRSIVESLLPSCPPGHQRIQGECVKLD
jgi:hypothetical protein